jgi:enoyl-CoA hydratase/carnithine racemase
MNMLLAVALRIVRRMPGCCAGSSSAGCTPAAGHFVILSRLIGREAAAAAATALFGEEINGDNAVALGLAWESRTTPRWRTGPLSWPLGLLRTRSWRGWRSATSAGRSSTVR